MSKVPTPKPTGEYAVGMFTYTVYDALDEAMYCAPGTKRSIPAKVYYPVSKESVEGMEKARYMSKELVGAIKKNYHFTPTYEQAEKEGTNRSECYENAPFIEGERFPLILFNHGYGSFCEAHTFLFCELASHGYVVVSIGHPYEAMLTELDDGRTYKKAKGISSKCYHPVIPSVLALKKIMKAKGSNEELWEQFDAVQKKYNAFLMERIPYWKEDTKAALCYLKENFADRLIDWEKKIGVTGHSMGGATAFALCEDEPERFICGINIDGGLFGNHDGKTITVPFLQMNCEPNKTSVTRAFISNKNVAYHAVFRDMQHIGFSDLKHFIPVKSLVGGLDPNVAHEHVCRIILEFFDAYLKKSKEKPSFESDDVVTFTEYGPYETQGQE